MAEQKNIDDVRRMRTAALWANALARTFKRVALFEIRGTDARVVYLKGLELSCRGQRVSLMQQTPLRWSIEAASPIVGSGRSPGVEILQQALRIEKPRAFTVMPIVIDGKIRAFTYADNESEPFSLEAVSQLFETCQNAVNNDDPDSISSPKRRARRRSSAHFHDINRRGQRGLRIQRPTSQPQTSVASRATQLVEGPLSSEEPAQPSSSSSLDIESSEELHIVTPDGIVPLESYKRRQSVVTTVLKPLSTLASGMAAIALFGLLWFAPVGGPSSDQRIEIARGATVREIGQNLEAQGLVRSGRAFQLLARVRGVDQSLRAGHYRLKGSMWSWTVLEQLVAGQLHTKSVTIPEGLTLSQIAERVERSGLADADSFLAAARDDDLLTEYGLPTPSFEGFLFPETYRFAEGLNARDLVEAMADEFFERFAEVIPEGTAPDELIEKIILASLIEREARSSSEMPRIAGVFQNRIREGMRLESCATIQYILGKPKERLLLRDLRIESPYNTYLNRGLPPGPIASPSADAIAAAFDPESHDYLFFFARKDGSGTHVFSKTYREHQRKIARQKRRRR